MHGIPALTAWSEFMLLLLSSKLPPAMETEFFQRFPYFLSFPETGNSTRRESV